MSRDILAPMPGTVHEIIVELGDQVDAHEEIIVIAAMKMENSVYTPVSGRVTAIMVEEDQKVDANQVLVTIDESP